MKKFDGYLREITSLLDGAYSQGYTDGYDRAKTLFGEHDRGVAHFQRATEEQIAAAWNRRYGDGMDKREG